ncbi:MAG TPA: Coq4 family protein [Kofleriaceae bacterium]
MMNDINHEIDATEMPAAQRWGRALAALGKVLADPERTDQVLVFSVYANAGTMRDRIHLFLDDPAGRRLFEEHRTIDARSVDLDALGALPVGTLGRAYADFLRRHQLSPDVFEAPPEEVRDPAIAYVIQRLRQTHDLWHVVTGYETDPGSEIALQAFTFGQLRAPSSLVLALAGSLRAGRIKPALVLEVAYAMRAGRRAQAFAAFPWEDHWQTPLSAVRDLLGISPAFVDRTERARLENYPSMKAA